MRSTALDSRQLGQLFGFVRLTVVSVVCSLLFFLRGDIENRSKSPDSPRNHTQLINTHKKQDKTSISLIFFKFPTDWGACAYSRLERQNNPISDYGDSSQTIPSSLYIGVPLPPPLPSLRFGFFLLLSLSPR